MPNAVADRVDLFYVAEVAWGTTPATPALKKLRYTGESLNAAIQTAKSMEIRADRSDQDLIQVGSEAGGEIEFEMSPDSFDDLIEAVMAGTWTANVLVNGNTEKSFTIQKRLNDVTQYFNFPGSRINGWGLNITPNEVVTGSFNVMAKEGARAATQFTGATFPAPSVTTPFNGAVGVTLAQIDALAIPGGLMNFSLNVTNNMRAQDVVGQLGAAAIVFGKFEATGEMEIYFADGTLYDKFVNMTPFAAQIKLDQGPKEFWVDIPNAKFETVEVVAEGTDTDVVMKASYRALFHTATAGSLKITRVP